MFKIISLREDGSFLESVNEVPAFYALLHNNVLMGYFTTIEAARLASEDLITYGIATDNTIVVDFSVVNKIMTQEEQHDKLGYCEEEKCQECCSHDERDHGICLDCEHEEDPGIAIDRAMDRMEDR